MSAISDVHNLYVNIYEAKNPLKDPGTQIRKSSGAGALSPEAAEELGDKAKELRKRKLAKVGLPSIKKEEVEEDALEKEAMKPEHRNPKGTPKKSRGGDPRPVKEEVCPICGEDPCQCLEGTLSEIHTVAKDTEVPTGDIKKLVKKAVKRIDTDVDGDTDKNDKAKGELGEFIPGVGNKRLYSNTGMKTSMNSSFSDWRGDMLDEVHWNPVTKQIEKERASKEEIESLAATARTKKKKRKPLGSIRKNSDTFKPSSREQAKADKASWDSYWEGSFKSEEYTPEEFVLEAKGISRAGALQALHNHKYSKQELWNMQKKATSQGDHGMSSALYAKWKEMKEEVISEKEMTAAEKKKESRLKDKYDDSEMKQNMIDQYGKEKGTQIYFAKIRKMAMEAKENALQKRARKNKEAMDTGFMNLSDEERKKESERLGRYGGPKFATDMDESSLFPNEDDYVGPYDKLKGRIKNTIKKRDAEYKNNYQLKAKKKKNAKSDRAFNEFGEFIRKKREESYFDYEDVYNYIMEMFVEYNFAEDYDSAEAIFENISEEFTATLVEEYLEEKARGTRKKKTSHIYDMDETLYGHDHSKVRVHVNDGSGKRVQSLSNQEFNTHKLQPSHKYDFSEFGSSKTFQKSAKPLKKMIKHMKRQKARGYDTHIVTARSDFDDKHHLAKQLKRHGVDITPNKKGSHTHLHRSGNEEGTDVGKKKQKVLSRLAKRHGYSKIHMYDDAEKVHKATHGKTPGVKVKGHMVKPNKSGEVYSRPYKPTQPKGGKNNNTQKEETAYEYWKQFID